MRFFIVKLFFGLSPTRKQRDVAGVSAKLSDVVLDPLDGEPLVEEAGVAVDALDAVEKEEAQAGHPVLQGRHDDVLLGGQDLGVVDVEGGGAAVEGPAVDPELK